ncbi:MAG: hypothetical protein ACOY93_12225 [Bacillota bacterium]
MTKHGKWILTGATSLAVAGLLFAVPALAQEAVTGPWSMIGRMTSGTMAQMHQTMMQNGHMAGMASGEMAAMHERMAPLMSEMPAMHEQVMGEVAQLLGLTPEQLEAAMADGKSLTDLATEQNLNPTELERLMTEKMEAFLNQAVEAGTITREQAEEMQRLHQEHAGGCLSGQMGEMTGMMSGTHADHH